jgi:hypothetical protein
VPSVVAYIAIGVLSFMAGGFLIGWLDTQYCNKLEGQRFQARIERDQALEENTRLARHIAETGEFKEAV